MMTTIFSGLSVGALYTIIACALTISLVRCGVFNFAQAHYILLSAYISSELVPGMSWWLVFPILIAAGALLGAAQEILTVRPVHGVLESMFVTTLGVSVVIEGFIIVVWGIDPRSVPFFAGDESMKILGGILQPVDLTLILGALGLVAVLQWAVVKTRWGLLGRVAAADQVAGMIRGVNIPRLRTMAFVLAGALSFALGPVLGAKAGIALDGVLHLIVFAFAAMAIGGFGSFTGSLLGGMIVGLTEAFCARYLGVDWATLVIFAVLGSLMLMRPEGLLGVRQLRVV